MNGSGTTMLLDCLAGHSKLFGYRGETKVLPYFMERQPEYGDLSEDANFTKLWLDLRATFSRDRWPAAAEPSAIAHWGARPRTAAQVFDAIMTALAGMEGKSTWCEKTPMYVHHVSKLAAALPGSKFIHVIRDGRDCAASFHRRWKFHPVRTSYRWKQAIRAGRSQGSVLGPRYCEIRYEDLTAEPETSLGRLCNFLDVSYEPAILKPARVRPQMTGSSMAEIAPNQRRAQGYFARSVLEKMERVAGQVLAECGYEPVHASGDLDPPRWQLRWWELLDDSRRMREALRRAAEVGGKNRFKFLSRRVKGALRQKSTL
jgi:hypothetical protein